MWRSAVIFGLFAVVLSGCVAFPQLDHAISPAARQADYPKLVPMDQITTVAAQSRIEPGAFVSLQTRVSRLKVRAAALRRPVLDHATRARLRAAMARRN